MSSEPGAGKTRLAEEVLARARDQGVPAFAGRCSESERGLPLLPFVEILEAALRIVPKKPFRDLLGEAAPEIAKLLPQLRSVYDDVPEPLNLPPEDRRRFLFNAVLRFMERASEERGLVLFVDDVQWADESSLGLLAHLAPHLETLPVLLLAAYRETEVDQSRPFFRTLEMLTRKRLARRIALRPLPVSAVATMLERLAGSEPRQSVAAAIHEKTDGNPFFVEEVFQHSRDAGLLFDADGHWKENLDTAAIGVPESVRLVIQRRLARLAPATQVLLRNAAVIGRSFELDVLEPVTPLAEDAFLDAVDEAAHAGLVRSSSKRPEAVYFFAHDLIRHTLVERLSPRRRRRLHLAIAQSFEKVYAGRLEERPEALAHHYDQAGDIADRGTRLRYLLAAGEKALETASAEDAVRHLTAALELCPVDDPAKRARLLFLRGVALRVAVRWKESFRDWQEALSLFESTGTSREVAQICENLWSFFGWTGQWGKAAEIAKRGLASLGEARSSQRARLLTQAALACDTSRAHEEASRMRALALEIAEELEDDHALGLHHFHVGSQCFFFPHAEALVASSLEGAAALRRAKEPWEWCPALVWAQVGQVCLGRFDEARKLGDRALAEAKRVGHVGTVAWARRNDSLMTLMRDGDLKRFETLVNANIDLCRKIGVGYVFIEIAWRGMAQLYQGRFDEAIASFRESADEEDAEGGGVVARGTGASTLFYGLAYVDPDSALGYFESTTLPELLDSRNEPYNIGEWTAMLHVSEALVLLGEEDEAASFYPDFARAIERNLFLSLWSNGLVQKLAGMTAACAREWDRAERHFETALEQAETLPHRIDQPEVRRFYAWMLRRRGRRGDDPRASELESEACELYQELGMTRHVAMLSRAR